MRETTKYKCLSCGWHGDTLGDRPTDDGDVECCPMCDSDDIAVTPNVFLSGARAKDNEAS